VYPDLGATILTYSHSNNWKEDESDDAYQCHLVAITSSRLCYLNIHNVIDLVVLVLRDVWERSVLTSPERF
jgi:hypothetical protein